MSKLKYGEGHQKLWQWFGLDRDTFVVLPRVMMREMPDEWQGKMADLLEEWDKAYPNRDKLPSPYVSARDDKTNKFIKWPQWLLNYRHPDMYKIKEMRGANVVRTISSQGEA